MTLAQSLPVGEHPDPDAQRGGIGADRRYFLLLLVQVGVVGLTVGIERVVVPLLGRDAFGLDRRSAILSFIVAFGLAKAPLNLVAGAAAARIGGRRVLLIGWLSALPVPFLLALAPSWSWVIAANVFLGVQQGLCWSATIIMKVDLARPSERGFAIGLNELVGYAATAAAAYGGAVIAASYGLRTAPFVVLGALVLTGGVLAALTPERSREAKTTDLRSRGGGRALPGFFVICQAGLVTKLADVAAWGLLPLHLRDRGLSIATVGLLSAVYPLAWAAFQPATGWLSDRIGRSAPIAGGLAAQAAGLASLAASDTVTGWIAAAVILGVGTALVYPVLLAAAADLAPPEGRAKSVGLYRFWRDLGFVVGGVAGGPVADALGIPASLVVLAAVSLVSMALFLTRSPTTRPGRETSPPPPAPPGRETSPPPPARARNSP